MSDGRPVGRCERLPWLEPYRDPRFARQAEPRGARHSGWSTLVTGLAVAVASGGGYWLGSARRRPKPIDPDRRQRAGRQSRPVRADPA